jgi:alpha-tubulin suppressor-like RCC1 family protein
VTAVAVGAGHSCALLQSQEVWCWGKNDLGQLGRGAAGASSATPAPVVTDGAGAHLANVTAIASHLFHTCAIRSDGAVLCWGRDPNGELGASPDDPVDCMGTPCRGFASKVMRAMDNGDAGVSYQAAFDSPPTAIATGWSHSCALLGNGTVSCWGYDGSGELGGAPGPPDASPHAAIAVPGASTDNLLRNVAAISVGGASTCALLGDGSARCWGWNATGKLGDGGYDQKPGPVPVAW